jgi:hypothetical protein
MTQNDISVVVCQSVKIRDQVLFKEDRTKYTVQQSYTHIELPYTLAQIDEHAKTPGPRDSKARPNHLGLEQIQGDLLLTTSDDMILVDKRSGYISNIQDILVSFGNLRETWVHKEVIVNTLHNHTCSSSRPDLTLLSRQRGKVTTQPLPEPAPDGSCHHKYFEMTSYKGGFIDMKSFICAIVFLKDNNIILFCLL